MKKFIAVTGLFLFILASVFSSCKNEVTIDNASATVEVHPSWKKVVSLLMDTDKAYLSLTVMFVILAVIVFILAVRSYTAGQINGKAFGGWLLLVGVLLTVYPVGSVAEAAANTFKTITQKQFNAHPSQEELDSLFTTKNLIR